MAKGDELISIIESHRVMSNDGSLVTYDLTKGVDFSNPKITAEALAAVFFRKMGIKKIRNKINSVGF